MMMAIPRATNVVFSMKNFRLRQIHLSRKASIHTISKNKLSLDPSVLKNSDEKLKFSQHPGVMHPGIIKLPQSLENSIMTVISKFLTPNLKQNSQKLAQYLHSRHVPTEPEDLKERALLIEKDMIGKKVKNFDQLDPATQAEESNKYKDKVLTKLKRQTYNWKPIKYDAPKCLQYMVGRMPQEFSVLTKIFTEIKKRNTSFKPQSLFDYGSGVGTVIWAANNIWPKSLIEHYCVDESGDMNTLSRLLLQDGQENKEVCFKGIFHRQFFPASIQLKYDVVVSAYSLMELANSEIRKETLLSLWNKTNDFLVIVEDGTNAGFKLILEARRLILEQLKEYEFHENQTDVDRIDGHIHSPCPHDMECPMPDMLSVPCNFSVRYRPIDYMKNDQDIATEKYSYVIFKKGNSAKNKSTEWPRLIRPISKPSKHVHCHMCMPSGNLEHHVITAKRNGDTLYQCAKKCKQGDLLPAVSLEITDSNKDL